MRGYVISLFLTGLGGDGRSVVSVDDEGPSKGVMLSLRDRRLSHVRGMVSMAARASKDRMVCVRLLRGSTPMVVGQ